MSTTEQISDPTEATFDWLQKERAYQVGKFGIELDDIHTKEGDGDQQTEAGVGKNSWWFNQITMYLQRAKVTGLDNPIGRQAAAKATATACGMLESVIRTYGDLPAPGVSSGNI